MSHHRDTVVRYKCISLDFIRVLELWASSYKSLACLVGCVLLEVLDEAGSEILCLLLPLACALVSVAWVEDSWINVWKRCWNLEVEHWDFLGLSLQD